MKKIFISLFSILLTISVMAQLPGNRSVQTVIADALAQLPSNNQLKYNGLMKDLAGTGEEGILSLASRLKAPEQGNNAAVEYALSGISHYVSNADDENLRATISNAYVNALKAAEVKESRQFIISQLQIVGKDEAVDALAPLLGNPDLSDNAARALASIGTEKAGNVLKIALLRRMGTVETQRNVVNAIGEAQVPGAEELLLGLLQTDNEGLKKDVLFALSRVGGIASEQALKAEAEKVGWQYDKTGATDAYLALLEKSSYHGDNLKTVAADALHILKNTPENAFAARIAALDIYSRAERTVGKEANVWKEITNALKSDNKSLRVAALANSIYLKRSAISDKDKTLRGLLKKEKDPERQTELIHAMSEIAINDFSFSKESSPRTNSLFAGISSYLQDKNPQVRQTAMREIGNLVRISPANSQYVTQLVKATDSDDPDVVNTGLNVLKSLSADNLVTAIKDAIPTATDKAKIAFLDILASRKATQSLNSVLSLIRSGSPEVKTAAYKALKDVVTANDTETILSLALSAEKENLPDVQQAGIEALSYYSVSDQIFMLKEGMNQAGSKKYIGYLPLAVTGSPEAIPFIKDGLKSSNRDEKDAAFDALLNWNGADAAGLIYGVCKDPSASEFFDRALDAYVKKVSAPAITGENRLIFLRKAIEIAQTDAQKKRILQQIGQTGTFLAMLYAGEFLDTPALKDNAAQAVMNIALAHSEYDGDLVVALLQKASAALGNPDADYQRKAIEKHLDELPKGQGFVSLFNGVDLTGWKGLLASPNDNPLKRITLKAKDLTKLQAAADEQMRKDWIVENGLLAFVGSGFDNLCTQKQYGDFEMYVDWLLDPSGKEADAGIYLRGTPQVQIWDIARTNAGAQVGSGGLYNNQTYPSKPLKVADNKMGEWNTLYIKMVGDRVTVKLNGELVVDNVILENFWDRKLPLPEREQIELQAHGSKVYYRNIYLKELERPKPSQLTDAEKKEGFKMLFDGTNMNEWIGNLVDYQPDGEGNIAVKPSGSFGGNLYTKGEYANFAFRFEFQLTPAANNGVGIRA
ncbi:MAG: DUF1080 domain-containing protein, partial [Tannerella sp.]|nr:DUF1080 domain-containing protein [Tannerella sp.]